MLNINFCIRVKGIRICPFLLLRVHVPTESSEPEMSEKEHDIA